MTVMTIQASIPDFTATRQAMVDSQLRPEGVNDPALVAAMGAVPRELFVPEAARAIAYNDRAIPLGGGRSLSAPASLGLLLTGMEPLPGDRALVVGAATGYSAAVLAAIGLEVTAVESSPELAAVARERGVAVVEGSLEDGYSKGGPYDLILIDGAVEIVPQAIVDQLKDGGRLGAALIDRGVTRLVIGIKAAGGIGYHSIADAGVAALPGFKRPRAFTF